MIKNGEMTPNQSGPAHCLGWPNHYSLRVEPRRRGELCKCCPSPRRCKLLQLCCDHGWALVLLGIGHARLVGANCLEGVVADAVGARLAPVEVVAVAVVFTHDPGVQGLVAQA